MPPTQCSCSTAQQQYEKMAHLKADLAWACALVKGTSSDSLAAAAIAAFAARAVFTSVADCRSNMQSICRSTELHCASRVVIQSYRRLMSASETSFKLDFISQAHTPTLSAPWQALLASVAALGWQLVVALP